MKRTYLILSLIVLILLILVQMKAFTGADIMSGRDSQSNIFQEIQVLKDKNSDLEKEINGLEFTLERLNDQNSALEAFDEEAKEYKKLSGQSPIFGSGVNVVIDYQLPTEWVVDFINELFLSGAEAVEVNGIRITNRTDGFDTMPQGQMLLKGSILSPPYVFQAIGEYSTIVDILEVPGGIFDRLEATFPNIDIAVQQREIIQMK